MIILLIIAFICIVLWEVPALIRGKKWRELTAFSLFLLLAFALSLLNTIGVKIPSPMKGIQHLFKDILHLSYK
jgi:hypothetical protein